MAEPARKRRKSAPPPEPPAGDGGLGGLYDFLPPPDPEKDAAAKAEAKKKELPPLPPEDKSRVVFLDIDGVLLPAGSVETITIDGAQVPVREKLAQTEFSAAALGNLRSIVQQTGACIVLSSEWRRTESMKNSIGTTLREKGLPQLSDATAVLQVRPDLVQLKTDSAVLWCERRAREIGGWLKQHTEVKSFVALDDLDFIWADGVKQQGTPLMKCRSVCTHAKHCLTETDAAEAVRILLNPPQLGDEESQAAVEFAAQATAVALARAREGGPPLMG